MATGGIESGKIVAGATVKIPDRVLCPLLQGWAWHTSPRCRRDGERTAVYGYLGAGETAPPFFSREAAARACLHNSYAERRVEQTPRKGLPADFPRAFFATRAFRRGAFNVQTLGGV